MSQEYTASAIKVLKGLEAVRKRPGMYIGNTDEISGLHHMIFEVADNAIDEALAGYCNNIKIILHRDGSASVEDNGRGMPVDIHPQEGIPAAEVIMTQLHAGGKFSQDAYKVSGGLHGVGVSVVNALSKWLKLTVWKNGQEYEMEFERGITTKKLVHIGPTEKKGTMVQFLPDHQIFSKTVFELDDLVVRFRELAFLNPGVKIILEDIRDTPIDYTFFDMGGVLSFVKFLSGKKRIVHNTPVVFNGSRQDVGIDCAIVWTDSEEENALFFTNTIPQRDGGTHMIGLRAGLTRAFQQYIKERGSKVQQKLEFSGEDIREGMTCVLSIKVADPSFSSQTKEKLVSSNVRQAVESAMTKAMHDFLEQNPSEAGIIIQKIVEACNAKEAARRARMLSKKKKGDIVWQVSQKLAACSDKDPSKCELFIVEGEGAGGSAKQARNRMNQAVLPLRGKILNIEKSKLAKVLNSEILCTLVGALGTGIGADFDIEKLRYHKVIIMTDADVDGKHIQSLLITFFYRNFVKLIEHGYLYIAAPPLYGITEKKGIIYLKDDKEFIKYLMNRGLKNINLVNATGDRVLESDSLLTFMLTIHGIKHDLVAYPEIYRYVLSAKLFGDELYNNMNTLADYMSKRSKAEWCVQGNEIWCIQNGVETRHVIELNLVSKKDRINFTTFTNAWGDYWDKNTFLDKEYIYDPFDLLKSIIDKGKEGIIVQRFKGLGEMKPEQLRVAIMGTKEQRAQLFEDEAQHRYIQLKLDKAFDMDQLCTDLMGDNVQARRGFIEANACYAQVDD